MPESLSENNNYFQSSLHPNPFNTSTNIEYSLNEPAYLSICIYNVLGEKIRTLLEEEKNQGQWSLIWNGKNDFGTEVPDGIYMIEFRSKNHCGSLRVLRLNNQK